MRIAELRNTVNTIVETKARAVLGSKYSGLNFTSTNLPSSSAQTYPCVYFNQLSSPEAYMDCERGLNAILFSEQIEVITNVSQGEADEIMDVLIGIFKDLRFEINSIPYFDNGTAYYRSVMRVRRYYTDNI